MADANLPSSTAPGGAAAVLSKTMHPISVKGKIRHVPALRLDDVVITVKGAADHRR